MQLEDVITGLPYIVRDHYQRLTGQPDCLLYLELCETGELETLHYLVKNEPRLELREHPEVFQFRKDIWARALAETLMTVEKKQLIEV